MENPDNSKTSNQNQKESTVKSSFFFLIAVFLIAVIADQLSRHYAKNIFYNSNFAFSLPLPVWLMYGVYFLVLAGMVFYLLGNHRKLAFLTKIAWALIFAGAVSNIVERIFLGHVRDFIYITFMRWTGIYNLADFYIIFGIIILLSQSFNQDL